jgi:hypothetical protein
VRHFGWRISLVLHLEAPAIVVGWSDPHNALSLYLLFV